MTIRTTLRAGAWVAVAVMTTTTLGAAPAGAVPGWQATLLPLPVGHPEASGFLTGTDGKGGYSGNFYIDEGMQVITWRDGKPSLRGTPAGYDWPSVDDQNSAGTVLVTATDTTTGGYGMFTLDDGGYRPVAPPIGYTSAGAVAINSRGDILGTAWKDDSTKFVTVLWPVLGVGPMVIPDETGEYPVDLDDDGTILFTSDGHASVWRNGQADKLAIPAGFDAISGSKIRNGAIVGYARGSAVAGILWSTPGDPKPLEASGSAQAINASGLIAGELPPDLGSAYGPPAAWHNTTFLGKLPMPDGFERGHVYAVGDDGAITGFVSNRPLDEGGAPVVWHHVGISG
jgi:hypothetical protein